MKRDELITKLANNKLLLYIIPNFVYLIILFNYYNVNFLGMLEVTFLEIIFDSCLFFGLTNILYFIILKILKSRQKTFLIMTFICMFYNIYLSKMYLIMLLLFVIICIIELKVIVKCNIDKLVFILQVIVCVMFLYNSLGTGINLLSMVLNNRGYDYLKEFNVSEKEDNPDIYYIHCDGMMSFSGMDKYFNYDNKYLKEQLKGYYINDNGSLVAGHRTQRALVALFNPDYYDNFFNDYLVQLEDTYLEKKNKTDYYVDYYELEEKRFNNELIEAFKKRGYKIIGIGEYNAYTSFDVDYFYDFFNSYRDDRYLDIENSQLRLIGNDSSELARKMYVRFSNNKKILKRTLFSDLLVDYIPLKYEEIDYNKIDSSKYTYIDKVYKDNNYWVPKAIMKSLDETMKINNNKLTFIDFNMNHDPYLFTKDGEVVNTMVAWNMENYLGNYIYSSYILMDIVNFIKNNDKDAVIILQGDHGLHTASNDVMKNYFDVDLEGIQEIRNSVISAVYVPKKYRNGDEGYLNNPLNVSRYLVNNFVGNNYEYIN